MRRLATEHRSLHNAPLPPNFLHQPTSHASNGASDDITQFDVLIAGPQDTPYAQGIWRLHLKMPEDYPRSPPKASFRTRIWHPNVEENTGAVCVDTLKRDWRSELTVRDVLVTISCLLIHPNPDSALNSSAGQLLQEDYEGFARHAKLMTSIHAPVARDLRDQVVEATQRGEDLQASHRQKVQLPSVPTYQPARSSVSAIRRSTVEAPSSRQSEAPAPYFAHTEDESEDENDDNDEASASKENDPSLSPSPLIVQPPSPRKSVLGKRPLSSLPIPIDPDDVEDEEPGSDISKLSSSQRNIANNYTTSESSTSQASSSSCVSSVGSRKSSKLSERAQDVSASERHREEADQAHHHASGPRADIQETSERPISQLDDAKPKCSFTDGKENFAEMPPGKETLAPAPRKHIVPIGFAARHPASRDVSASSTSSVGSGRSTKPRIGLRRL